jgi:hypothetical protein
MPALCCYVKRLDRFSFTPNPAHTMTSSAASACSASSAPSAIDPAALGKPQTIRLPRRGLSVGQVCQTIRLYAGRQTRIFRHGTSLAVVIEPDGEPVQLEFVTRENAASFLERAFTFTLPLGQAPNPEVPATPSRDLVAAILGDGEVVRAFPEVRVVTDIQLPWLTPEGTVELTPLGFHPQTGTYTSTRAILVPEIFDTDPAAYLKTLFLDFTFRDRASLLVSLAYGLTLAARVLLRQLGALSPLFVFDANTARAGKDAQPRMFQRLVLGGSSEFSCPRKDEEFDVVLESVIAENIAAAHFSNVNRDFGSEMLERVVTSDTVRVRRFHTKTHAVYRHSCVISFSSNGGALRGDLSFRALVSHLQWPGGDPNQRRYSRDLDQWSSNPDNRAGFLSFVLFILRDAARAGWPVTGASSAAFPGWMRYVGMPVKAAGGVDFIAEGANNTAEDAAAESQTGEQDDWRTLARILCGLESVLDRDGAKIVLPHYFPDAIRLPQLRHLVALIQEHDRGLFSGMRMVPGQPEADVHSAATRFGFSIKKIAGRTFDDWSCSIYREGSTDAAKRQRPERRTYQFHAWNPEPADPA